MSIQVVLIFVLIFVLILRPKADPARHQLQQLFVNKTQSARQEAECSLTG